MKKVLFTSTALVAFTGAAAAEVSLSGSAEIGVFGRTGVAEAQFFQDIDVTFTMSGETDNGLAFGASVDLDEGIGDGGGATDDNSDDGGATIFISGAFGTVTLGDTDGALDWALTEAGNIRNGGSLADDETSYAGYVGSYLDGEGDGQVLRYDFSAGDFGVAVSLESDEAASGNSQDYGYAVGFRYNVELGAAQVALGIGYQEAAGDEATGDGTDIDVIGVSAAATFDNGFSVGLVYTDWSGDDTNNDSSVGVGVGYSTGALTLHANYGLVEQVVGEDIDGFGLSAAYDLGGGAVIHAGYGDGEDVESASVGLGLSF